MRTCFHIAWLILFLAANSPVVAQQWCPPGAEWSFNYESIDWGTGETHDGVLIARYTGDTLLGGQTAQRINQVLHSQLAGSGVYSSQPAGMVYTYASADAVHIWNSGSYDTLLWFGAAPGDTWPVTGLPAEYRFEVLDTATVSQQGVPLRRLVVRMLLMEDPIGPIDTLRERTGFDLFYLFAPGGFLADGSSLWFRCYRDEDITYPDPGPPDCGFTMDIPWINGPSELRVFPNPGGDVLRVNTPAGISLPVSVHVHDTRGLLLGSWRMPDGGLELDTSSWPAGLYLVRLLHGLRSSTAKWSKAW
ncbi:MAG: T9SS type A sorting domain-containing protein [Flavobacteriales bacterium]